MKLHQVLTGSCNHYDQCLAVGSVEAKNFIAYASGCDLVILDEDFSRIQIIPGVTHGYVQITCVDCCEDTGKIAVSYGNSVKIFEPSAFETSYRWHLLISLSAGSTVLALTWSPLGDKLLTCGTHLQLWQPWAHDAVAENSDNGGGSGGGGGGSGSAPVFSVGEEAPAEAAGAVSHEVEWRVTWQSQPGGGLNQWAGRVLPAPSAVIKRVSFSSDGTLFASLMEESCNIEVWFNCTPEGSPEPQFRRCVLSHPHPVVDFTWRKASRYMPIGAVANSLVSSCEDGVCRIYTESRLPTSESDSRPPEEAEGPTVTQPRGSRGRLLSYLTRKRYRQLNPLTPMTSSHERRKFLHFHLSATISSQSDIPLLPFVSGKGHRGRDGHFILHWLDNKEMQFTVEATKLLIELQQKLGDLEQAADPEEMSGPLDSIDPRDEIVLDRRIDLLMAQWYSCPDMLFAVNPIDGSLLVWLVDDLDSSDPLSHKHAQVSFSSRLPLAIPIGDAMSMAPNLFLYPTRELLTGGGRGSRALLPGGLRRPFGGLGSRHEAMVNPWKETPPPATSSTSWPGRGQSNLSFMATAVMISKHENGSLNQWQLSFAENSKYQVILSLSHVARISGHRFHTNGAACHPALPLLLTTSHHNLPSDHHASGAADSGASSRTRKRSAPQRPHEPSAATDSFCSELILWQVESVGPLTRAGGLTELARINSPKTASFTNVTWLPTLLPSFSIGIDSKSPGALFVTHDGASVGIYLAVIDARFVLGDPGSGQRPVSSLDGPRVSSMHDSSSSESAGSSSVPSPVRCFSRRQSSRGGPLRPSPAYNIVSLQSTARPGCIIALDTIEKFAPEAGQEKTLLLHAFQEQLVTGRRTMRQTSYDPIVNLATQSHFEERFYLVSFGRRPSGECHVLMWCVTVKSCDHEEHEDNGEPSCSQYQLRIRIASSKACDQTLPLPPGVTVVKASVAAGHSSAASIYPACFSPYLVVTGCSDGCLRFWRTAQLSSGQLEWQEWPMLLATSLSSRLDIGSRPLAVSCAYSGRVAVASADGPINMRLEDATSLKIKVAIYECESTGGSEWTLEDVIELNHVPLPESDCADLNDGPFEVKYDDSRRMLSSYILQIAILNRWERQADSPMALNKVYKPLSLQPGLRQPSRPAPNSFLLKPKSMVHLDWVSTEDGSHVLSVAVGTQIQLYSTVSRDIIGLSHSAYTKSTSAQRPTGFGPRMPSPVVPLPEPEPRWMKLRQIDLHTADRLPPLPMHTSWVREGLLVVGMENEIHVYSQWKDYTSQSGSSAQKTQPSSCVVPGTSSPRMESETKRNLEEQALNLVPSNINLTLIKQTYSVHRLTTSSSMSRLASKRRSIDVGRSVTAVGQLTAMHGAGGGGGATPTPAPTFAPDPSEEAGLSLSFINDIGMFEAVQAYNTLLPQYHPRQLMEWMNFGRLKRVKAILAHLTRCISSDEVELSRARIKSVTVTSPLKVSAEEASGREEEAAAALAAGGGGSNVEIRAIPPLPIFALLAVDNETQTAGGAAPGHSTTGQDQSDEAQAVNFQEYVDTVDDDVFNIEIPSEDEEEGGEERETVRESRKRLASPTPPCLHHFGPAQSKALTERVARLRLPGLTALDQMYLLAIADVMANTCSDVVERSEWGKSEPAASRQPAGRPRLTRMSTMGGETGGYAAPAGSLMGTTDSLDDCGLRFLLSLQHYSYLLKTLPLRQRAWHQLMGIGSSNFIWAFHSEAEEELIARLPSFAKDAPVWTEFKQYGAGWWLRNENTLRRSIEKIAKTAFQQNKDPIDAALYYIAMRKISILRVLFRNLDNKRMQEFFSQDFTQDRWRRAALKNAFQLMGMQRFEHAAAFFLLGGSLKDAVAVCIDRLQDLQLALVIIRLYEPTTGEHVHETLQNFLYEQVLGWDGKSNCLASNAKPHRDPFIRCMAWWMLKDHLKALDTLVDAGGSGNNSAQESPSHGSQLSLPEMEPSPQEGYSAAGPSVFNFYNFLRLHPLIVRQKQLDAGLQDGTAAVASAKPGISTTERRLYFKTAHNYFQMGCPALALEVLTKLPEVEFEEEEEERAPLKASAPVEEPPAESSTDIFSWGVIGEEPKIESDEPDFELKWSDDEEEKEDDAEDASSKKEVAAQGEAPGESGAKTTSGKLDIMAHQLKFIACLKIIAEELSTLATGIEADGGTLRRQFYMWLEKERSVLLQVNVLQQLCHYGCDLAASGHPELHSDTNLSPVLLQLSPHLSASEMAEGLAAGCEEPNATEPLDVAGKLERIARRRQWLLANQALLRSLMSFCSLHGASGVGLAAVRMELMLLLQEVQQERVSLKAHQLLTPLPFPTTLPLLSAAVAQAKTITANPIQHLKGLVRDSFDCFLNTRCPYALDTPQLAVSCCGLLPSAQATCPRAASCLRTSFLQSNAAASADVMAVPQPPKEAYMLRNLVSALSACVYQCLSDSTAVLAGSTHELERAALEGFMNTRVVYKDGSLLQAAGERGTVERLERIACADQTNTTPIQWPGVSTLKTMLSDRADVDTPNMVHLLTECLVSVYVGVLHYALWQCDPGILYRLAAHQLDAKLWAMVFGGGLKKPLRPAAPPPVPTRPGAPPSRTPRSVDSHITIIRGSRPQAQDPVMRNRMQLYNKVLNTATEDHDKSLAFNEKFIHPRFSIIVGLLEKPHLPRLHDQFVYDSDDSLEEEEEPEQNEDDYDLDSMQSYSTEKSAEQRQSFAAASRYDGEHSDPMSYAWCLMRYALVQLAIKHVHELLQLVQLEHGVSSENEELPMSAPRLYRSLKRLEEWERAYKMTLDSFKSPPENFLSQMESAKPGGPFILKYKRILEKDNTPFKSTHWSALPAKRLWVYLVHREVLFETFVRYIFRRPRDDESVSDDELRSSTPRSSAPALRIFHRDADVISSMCINNANLNCVAIATGKEVVELEIANLLHPPTWLDDELEYDIEMLRSPDSKHGGENDDYIVIAPNTESSSNTAPSSGSHVGSGSGGEKETQGQSNVMVKRPIGGVSRMSPHPFLPYYLCGTSSSSVLMYEWGHPSVVMQYRSPNINAKISTVSFNSFGSKFGIGDSEGMVSLWRSSVSSTDEAPIYSVRCHSRPIQDFSFVQSSSQFATASLSFESEATVCLWDTLMQSRRAALRFTESPLDGGCTALCLTDANRTLLAGTRRGELAVLDLRAGGVRRSFVAHDGPVRSIIVNPLREFIVTGGADGHVKIWRLDSLESLETFKGEHVKSSIFRSSDSTGVLQLCLADQHLFSCGADGSLKMRRLDEESLLSGYCRG